MRVRVSHRPPAGLLEWAALAGGRPAVRVAAAESLGRVGSAESVPTLRDAATRSDAGGMGRAVRQAVAGIHARLSGAEPGQLSLAVRGAGELSLAGDEPGSVSLVGDDRALGSDSPDEGDASGETSRTLQRPGTIQGKT